MADAHDDGRRPVTRRMFSRVLESIGKETAKHVQGRLKPLEDRIAALEQRKSLEFRGVWRADVEYGENDLTTHSGKLWLCKAQGTRKRPGDGDSWRLVSKEDLKS